MSEHEDVIQLLPIIEALLRDYPELKDDDELRLDMLVGETEIENILAKVVAKERDAFLLLSGIAVIWEDLTERRTRYRRRQEAMRELILKVMQAGRLKKIELPMATLSQRASQPAIVGHIDPAELPDNLCRISREASMSKIREALLAGDLIPGLNLSNAPPTLMIRPK